MQQNVAKVKNKEHLLPKPIVLKIEINGQPACALVDCGSLGDFLLLTLVDQLKLSHKILDNPVGLQIGCLGITIQNISNSGCSPCISRHWKSKHLTSST